jgi:hypothetical protein
VQGQFVYSSDQGLGLQLVELRIAAIAAPPGDEMLHLRAGVAAGAWKTLAAADTRGAKTVAGEAGSGAVFQAAEAETNQVVLRLMDTVGDVEDRRVVALDRQGGIHSPAWSKVDLLPGARLTTLAFKDVDLAGVKEFRLETRPFHWVEFRNVSLVVGRKTEVEAIAAPGPPGVEVRFVRLVVGLEAMTFEGETATEDALKERLEKVPDRARTVIELAVSGTDLSFARYDAVQQRLLKLKDELGFRSVSHVGEQPLGSRGSPPATAPDSGEAGTRSGGEDGAGSAWRFGPVVARVISGDRGEWMLDLDSGRTHGAVVIGGESSVPEAMDLSFVHAPSERGLQPSAIAALELQFRRGEDKDWDIDPAWIGWRLSIAESPGAPGQPDRSGFRTAPLASAQERLPLTFIFRTRQGNDGVLQFLQITENPGGVKLRYKMVEKAVVPGAPVPAASEDAARTEQRQGGPTRKPR